MNRDDITPEELDGLLVAFADNELDEPQFSEILELISENSTFNQDISAWNTSNVTNMSTMLYKAYAFNGYIGSWDTGAVENMYTTTDQGFVDGC